MNYYEYLNKKIAGDSSIKFDLTHTTTPKKGKKKNSVFKDDAYIKQNGKAIFEKASKKELEKVNYEDIIKEDDNNEVKMSPMDWVLKQFFKIDKVRNIADYDEDGELTVEEAKDFVEDLLKKDGDAENLSVSDFEKLLEEYDIDLKDILKEEEDTAESNNETKTETDETDSQTTVTDDAIDTDVTSDYSSNFSADDTVSDVVSDDYSVGDVGLTDSTDDIVESADVAEATTPAVDLSTMSLDELKAEKTTRETTLTNATTELTNAQKGDTTEQKEALEQEKSMKNAYLDAVDKDTKLDPKTKIEIRLYVENIAIAKTFIGKTESAITEKNNEITAQEGIISAAQSRLDGLQLQLQALQANSTSENNSQTDAINAIEYQIKLQEMTIKEEKEKQSKAKQELETLKTNLNTYNTNLNTYQDNLAQLEKEIKENKKECDEATKTALENYNKAVANTKEIKDRQVKEAQEAVDSAKIAVEEVDKEIVAAEKKEAIESKKAQPTSWDNCWKVLTEEQETSINEQIKSNFNINFIQEETGQQKEINTFFNIKSNQQ